MQTYLAEISGFDAVTLCPAAGAHGELTGILVTRAYHESRGEGAQRRTVIVPDSAHGTNPATAAMSGYKVITVKSDDRGNVDVEALKGLVGPDTAALMITNPNTLGLFDEHARQVVEIVHGAGGLVYNDGANFNAILGIVRPGDIGFDVMHFNLHKTFSSPHGGGGPGAGPVGVKKELARFLPSPQVAKEGGVYRFVTPEHSIGKIHGFHGNWGVILRAYTYIRSNGGEGLREVSETAVLNANYLLAQLRDSYHVPYDRYCMHEFVLNDQRQRPAVRTLDIAKRVIDYGFHPMTVYFPLIVEGAMLVEPTETETKQTLDAFAAAMQAIAREAAEDPEIVTTAPHNAPITRLDEATAARRPNLRWQPAAPAPEPEPGRPIAAR
jgi:glycine dehydrogenase subunit 2